LYFSRTTGATLDQIKNNCLISIILNSSSSEFQIRDKIQKYELYKPDRILLVFFLFDKHHRHQQQQQQLQTTLTMVKNALLLANNSSIVNNNNNNNTKNI